MAIAPPREHPLWLRIPLNASGPLGLGLALLGYINLVLGLLFTLIGIYYVAWELYPQAHAFVRRKRLVSLLVFLAVGLLLGFGGWVVVPKATPNIIGTTKPPFVAKVRVALTAIDREHMCDMWIGYKSSHGDTLSPVNAALVLALTNNQDVSSTVDRLGVDVKNASGDWVRLVRLPTNGTAQFWGKDAQSLAPMNPGTPLLEDALRDSIPPHKTVEGWLLFEYPQESPFRYGKDFRVALGDTAGIAFTSKSLRVEGGEDALHGGHLFLHKPPVDLSRWYRKYWTDQ